MNTAKRRRLAMRSFLSKRCLPYVMSVLFFTLPTPCTPAGEHKRLTSLEEALQRHNIALNKNNLLQALGDRDPEVRWLAAQKLAEDNATDAVPSIEKALDRDYDLSTNRVNIAFALARLRDERGFNDLRQMCIAPQRETGQKYIAAQYLLDLGDESCLHPVVDSLTVEVDTRSQLQGLALLPRFTHASNQERDEILKLLIKSLEHTTPAVRIQASTSLAVLGNRNTIQYLQSAIERERDEAVRFQMQGNLKILQRKLDEGRP